MSPFQNKNYDHYLMGPDAHLITQELARHTLREESPRILDLACGKALSSISLAHIYPDSHIYAVDLFVSPRKNYNRILIQGLRDRITPLHGHAEDLPFAYFYFDSIFCIDGFQIFGRPEGFLDQYIAPFLKLGGELALMMPGFTEEFISMPEALQPFPIQDLDLYSRDEWMRVFAASKCMEVEESFLLESHTQAWENWLNSKQPGTETDRKLYEQGGKYIDSLGFILRKTASLESSVS